MVFVHPAVAPDCLFVSEVTFKFYSIRIYTLDCHCHVLIATKHLHIDCVQFDETLKLRATVIARRAVRNIIFERLQHVSLFDLV